MHQSIPVLLLVFCLGNIPEWAAAKTGGISQTTFFSTDSGFYSGATSSSFIGPDGVTKGECTYNNGDGKSITIKYEETRDGKVTAKSDTSGVSDPDGELKKCQAKVGELQRNLKQNIQETQEAMNANMAQLENNFKEQMAIFSKQQETFAEQHRQFLRQMSDFSKRMEEQSRRFQDSFPRQIAGQDFNPFGFTFF